MALRLPAFLVTFAIVACGAPVPDTNDAVREEGTPPQSTIPVEPAPASVVPAAFHGTFDRNQASCAGQSDQRLTVSEAELRFHESIGVVRQVTPQGPASIGVAADYQGEGENWSARHQLVLSHDGATLTILGNGAETVRVRCAKPSVPSATLWQTAASGEGDGLFLQAGDRRILTLFCPAESSDLIVNVPNFRPVGSEERMSFGSSGTVVALVADVRGDQARGGVSGRGPIPDELGRILNGRAGIAVNYGAQNSGPHPAPPVELTAAFVNGCRD